VLLGLLRGLLRNPLILAILGGFACSLLQLRLPLPVARVVDLFAGASGPVALFVIGGTLVGLRPGGDLPRILWVSAGKLILHPLAVALALWAFLPGDPLLQAAGVIIAALPMFSIFPIIAQKYDEQSWCASTLLVATLGSFVTLSVVLWLVGASLRG
jgi:predicted permease